MDFEPIFERSGPGTDLGIPDLELPFTQEGFVEIDRKEKALKEKLNEKKVSANNSCVVGVNLVFNIAWLECLYQCPSVIRLS